MIQTGFPLYCLVSLSLSLVQQKSGLIGVNSLIVKVRVLKAIATVLKELCHETQPNKEITKCLSNEEKHINNCLTL